MAEKEEIKTEEKEPKKVLKPKSKKKKSSKNNFGRALGYFVQSKEELKKVTWSTRKEAVNYAILVLAISAVVAAFLGLVDYLLTKGLNEILKK